MCLCCAHCQDEQRCGAPGGTGASPTQLVTFISQVLRCFVPMYMEVWEGGFERKGSKLVLNVARWFDAVYLLFPGPRKLFFFHGCDPALWSGTWDVLYDHYSRCLSPWCSTVRRAQGNSETAGTFMLQSFEQGKDTTEAWRQQKSARVFICCC